MGKQLIGGLLSLFVSLFIFSCDHHGRVVEKQLTCGGIACDSIDNVYIHFLPSKKSHQLGFGTISVKADSLGMFYFKKYICGGPCKGCSKIVLKAADGGPALNVNFFYSEKKNDSDTLSTLGLLPFKGKLTYVKEVFYDEKRKPDTLGLIQF